MKPRVLKYWEVEVISASTVDVINQLIHYRQEDGWDVRGNIQHSVTSPSGFPDSHTWYITVTKAVFFDSEEEAIQAKRNK